MIQSSFSIDNLTKKNSSENNLTDAERNYGNCTLYAEAFRQRTESAPSIQRNIPDPTFFDSFRSRGNSMGAEIYRNGPNYVDTKSYRSVMMSNSRSIVDDSTSSTGSLDAYNKQPDSMTTEQMRNKFNDINVGLHVPATASPGKDHVINRNCGSDDSFRQTPSPSSSEDSITSANESSESIAQALLSLDKTIKGNYSRENSEKPPHSYIALISMAILSSPEKRMLLCDIYKFIMDTFEYYNNKGKAWRNSIRHNLSLNECFVKNGRSDNGKGNYWSIHPACIEDFSKGDFRRRRARRRARKCMKNAGPSETDYPCRMNPRGYVAMSSAYVGMQTFYNTQSSNSSYSSLSECSRGIENTNHTTSPGVNSSSCFSELPANSHYPGNSFNTNYVSSNFPQTYKSW